MLGVGEYGPRLELRRVAVAGLVKEAVDDLRPFLARRGQEIDCDVPADLSAAVDPPKIRDCIEHLLLNAIKFTPDGGRIAVAGGRAGADLELSVRDEGIGIDSASLAQVFEPFFTGFDSLRHSSGTYEFGKKGLGLGLPLVRAFVEMHGGRAEIASQVGKGTTVTLTLPVDGRPA
jgi:signal transduction histidine kinase